MNGKQVTVRVAPKDAPLAVSRYDESDVMLDAWCDLPRPAGTPVKVVPGERPLPDPPFIEDEI